MSDIKSDLSKGNITIDEARSKYNEWKNTSSYLIIATEGYNDAVDWETRQKQIDYLYKRSLPKQRNNPATVYYENYFAVKLMKRGNDVYVNKVKKNLQYLLDLCYKNKDLTLLNPKTQRGRSNILRIDLTYDTKRCSSEQSAKRIGYEYNLFLTNLKEGYGKISEFRVFEFTEKGMAHVHGVYIFHDCNFAVSKMRSRKNNLDYFRVSDYHRNKMRKMYHSNINVYALANSKQLNYCLKYLSKDFFDADASITPFLLSLYDNRAYGLSKDFSSSLNSIIVANGGVAINRLDYNKYNSKYNLSNSQYVGNFSSKMRYDKWVFAVKPPPYSFWNKNGSEIQIPNYFQEGQ